MARASGAWMLMVLIPLGGLADPPPRSSASDSSGAKIQLKVVPAAASAPAVRGQKYPLALSVTNLSPDVVVVYSLTTDREADAAASYLRDQYGSLRERDGKLALNSLVQQATPKVFFSRQALLLPGENKTLSVTTRLFEASRKLTLRSYRIAVPALGRHIYDQKSQVHGGIPGESEQLYVPIKDLADLRRAVAGDTLSSFVLWNSAALALDETAVEVSIEVRDPAFSLRAAQAKLPAGTAPAPVSFSDAYQAWLFGAPAGTWLVREQGAELLGQVDFAVFEKIDEVLAKDVRFNVPEQAFAGKGFQLAPGDGMYTRGTFLTASGDRLLDVLRVARDKALRATVHYYFFGSWYVALTPAGPAK